MRRLIIGLILVILLVVPVSCAEAVDATYEELKAAQQEAGQLLDELGLFVDSDINIKENQVQVYVTDSKLFYKTLQEADAQLPDHVVAIIVYEPLYEIPFEINPDPSVCFPQLKMRSGSFMESLMTGELILEDCYLRVDQELILWQPDYFVNNNDGTIEILDRNGEVVARVGEEVCMGGGEITSIEHINKLLKEPLPQDCEGPYWLMGEIVPSESEVEEEKPTLTEEQQELWVERGVLPVSTIEEASRLVGYPVATPTFIPEGFLPGDFELNQLGFPPQLGGEWGDGKRVVQRQWTWSGDRKIDFLVIQFPGTLESVQGEPSEVCGHSGKREFFEEGREYPLLVLHWWDGDMVYSVGGSLGGPLTEEILYQIACSVQASDK